MNICVHSGAFCICTQAKVGLLSLLTPPAKSSKLIYNSEVKHFSRIHPLIIATHQFTNTEMLFYHPAHAPSGISKVRKWHNLSTYIEA